MRSGSIIGVAMAAAALAGATGAAAAPAPLSRDAARVDIASAHGSGAFGRWRVDRFGLPAYRYAIDEETAPQAAQPELHGSRDAQHQLGNDHIVAGALNHGYVQLWSQDRRYQWTNRYDAATRHYGGGYGYLRLPGRTLSTLYDDRPRGARTERDFGTGYAHRAVAADGVRVDDEVYAPFGDDPILLHDVTIANTSKRTVRAAWFEYWDVNPFEQNTKAQIGLARPTFDRGRATLAVRQTATAADAKPLAIYAAALRGRVAGTETDASAFFGRGTRAAPAAVAADRARGGVAPAVADGAVGRTMFAFRTPVTIPAGGRVKLRYAYGAAQPSRIRSLVSRWRARPRPVRGE